MKTMEDRDLAVARLIRDRLAGMYLGNPRVRLLDIGRKIVKGEPTDRLVARIHVVNKPQGPQFESFAAQRPDLVIDLNLLGVAERDVDFIQARYCMQPCELSAAALADRLYWPGAIQGGVAVANGWSSQYGTCGGIVVDRRDAERRMLLSNWHVIGDGYYGTPHNDVFQPPQPFGGHWSAPAAKLLRHSMEVGVDAAVAELSVARRPGRNWQYGLGEVTGVGEPEIGLPVIKSGCGSGITHGVVDGVGGRARVAYGWGWREVRDIVRVVPRQAVGEVSCPGDSGSWWLDDRRRAVALHFAGDDDGPQDVALGIRFRAVLDALQVDVLV